MFEVTLPAITPKRKVYRPAYLNARQGFSGFNRNQPDVFFSGRTKRMESGDNIWWTRSRDGDFYPQFDAFSTISDEEALDRYLSYWA